MKKPTQAQNLTFFTFPFFLFSDLSSPASLTGKKTIARLETAWGMDLEVVSKVKSAVLSTFQEKKLFVCQEFIFMCSYPTRR